MANQNFTPKLLAHWIFTPDEWQAFSHYEQTPAGHRQSVVQFGKPKDKHFWGNIFLYAFILVFFVALPTFFYFKFEIPLLISVPIIAVISFLFLKFAFPEPPQKPAKTVGDVKITTHGVNLNGRLFDWSYAHEGWRLAAIEKSKISLGKNKTMDLLTFKCSNQFQPNGAKEITIPAPMMSEAEINVIVNAFNHAKNMLSEEETEFVWKNLNYELDTNVRPFAHDFDSKNLTCKKCGSSIEAARHFKLECKSL